MQVRPRKSNKNKIILIIITALLLVLVGGALAYMYASRPFESSVDTQKESSNTDKVIEESEKTPSKTDSTPAANDEPTKVEDKTPIQYEGEKIDDEPITDNEQFRIPEGEQ